jgi:hypothetical protein
MRTRVPLRAVTVRCVWWFPPLVWSGGMAATAPSNSAAAASGVQREAASCVISHTASMAWGSHAKWWLCASNPGTLEISRTGSTPQVVNTGANVQHPYSCSASATSCGSFYLYLRRVLPPVPY